MSNFRFLHAADIHLDSPLRGLSRFDNAPEDEIRGATRKAFDNVVQLAIDEAVDFAIIAGDLFDGSWKEAGTGMYFARAMGRLKAANIPVFILRGNHDAESKMDTTITWPDNVIFFDAKAPSSHELPDLEVVLHGQSFPERDVTQNLALGYPDVKAGWFNIGVLHTALAGHSDHAHYAPCSVNELETKGYAYWALGHVHEHAVHHESPWIVFPGNSQGRSVRETGAKGAVIVNVEQGAISRVQHHACDTVRWHDFEIDLSGVERMAEVDNLVRERLQSDNDLCTDRLNAVRLTFTGQTPLHGVLSGSPSKFRDRMVTVSEGIASPRTWLEKTRVKTGHSGDLQAVIANQDELADLATFFERAHQDGALVDQIKADLERLLGTMPAEAVDQCEELAAFRDSPDVAALLEQATPALLSRMRSAGGEA